MQMLIITIFSVQVLIRRNIWAGSLWSRGSNSERRALMSRKGDIFAARLMKREDIIVSKKMSVIYGECINRFCKRHGSHVIPSFDSSGSLVTSLFGGRGISATECAEHREGILCGQCKSGYSLTMYYAVSTVFLST